MLDFKQVKFVNLNYFLSLEIDFFYLCEMFKQLSMFDNPVIADEAISDSITENNLTTNLDTQKLAKLY